MMIRMIFGWYDIMSQFIPEITTRITVNIDTSELDDAMNVIQSDEILSDIPSLVDEVETRREQLTSLKEPVGRAVAECLKSNQENIIGSKHYVSGMMANSVDITEDGDDFLVGDTAESVDGFPYPLAIEKGTRDHWVEPVTYDALHWTDGDGDHFSKGHMVSGITPDPFVEPSIDDTMYDIDEVIDEVMKEVGL